MTLVNTLVKTIEETIRDLEGFDVIIKRPDGRNVRSDRHLLQGYPWKRAAAGHITAAQWCRERFLKKYPGYGVVILYGDGSAVAAGNTLLSTVRKSYL